VAITDTLPMVEYLKGVVMLNCIYVDVLIVLNWYINYFILLGTAKITHIGFKRRRLVLSALVGAISSLLIMLPPMNFIISVVIKLILSTILVLIAFGLKKFSTISKMSLYFCVISFIFAGMIMALKSLLNSNAISTNNSYVYADFSLGFLIVSTALCYGLLCLLRYFIDRNTGATGEWVLNITYDNRSTRLKGLADTGNALTDTFSGKPVIVCSKDSLVNILGTYNLDNIVSMDSLKLKGFRLIPYSTISNSGVIVSFVPDRVTITNLSNGHSKEVDVLIGISGDCSDAIFNPKILV